MRVIGYLIISVFLFAIDSASANTADNCKKLAGQIKDTELQIERRAHTSSRLQESRIRIQDSLGKQRARFQRIEPFCAGDLSVAAPQSYLDALAICSSSDEASIKKSIRRKACGLVNSTQKQLPQKTENCREQKANLEAAQRKLEEKRLPRLESRHQEVKERIAALYQRLFDLESELQNCGQSPATVTIDFQNIPLGTVFPLWQGLEFDAIKIEVSPLYYEPGVSSDQFADQFGPFAEIVTDWYADPANPPIHRIYPNNVNLYVHLPKCARYVSFEYWGGRGDVLNFIADDQLEIIKNFVADDYQQSIKDDGFTELRQAKFPNVKVRVATKQPLGPYKIHNGVVTVTGECVQGLAFGGQETQFGNIVVKY